MCVFVKVFWADAASLAMLPLFSNCPAPFPLLFLEVFLKKKFTVHTSPTWSPMTRLPCVSEFDVAVNVTSGSESGSRASVGRRRRPEETHVEDDPAARLRDQGSQDNLLKNHPKPYFFAIAWLSKVKYSLKKKYYCSKIFF